MVVHQTILVVCSPSLRFEYRMKTDMLISTIYYYQDVKQYFQTLARLEGHNVQKFHTHNRDEQETKETS